MEPTHDQMKDLIAPYVLGAVSAEETELVRAHIISCEECMAEADGYSSVVSSLALSVDAEPLPAGLIDGVMSEVQRDAGVDSTPALEPAETPATEPARTREDSTVTQLRPRRSSGTLIAVAASFVIVAILAGALITTTNELNDTRSDLDRQEERLTALVEANDGMRLGSPGGDSVGAMLPTEDGGIFLAHGLKDAPDNHTYQVWLIEDDQPVSAGTFDPSEGVGGLQTDHSLEGVEGVAVTVEPEGGSDSPTGVQILRS